MNDLIHSSDRAKLGEGGSRLEYVIIVALPLFSS